MGGCAQVVCKYAHYAILHKGLEHSVFWCPQGSWNQFPSDAEGCLYPHGLFRVILALMCLVYSTPASLPSHCLEGSGHSPKNLFAAANRILIHSHKQVHEQCVQRLQKKREHNERLSQHSGYVTAGQEVRGGFWGQPQTQSCPVFVSHILCLQ